MPRATQKSLRLLRNQGTKDAETKRLIRRTAREIGFDVNQPRTATRRKDSAIGSSQQTTRGDQAAKSRQKARKEKRLTFEGNKRRESAATRQQIFKDFKATVEGKVLSPAEQKELLKGARDKLRKFHKQNESKDTKEVQEAFPTTGQEDIS